MASFAQIVPHQGNFGPSPIPFRDLLNSRKPHAERGPASFRNLSIRLDERSATYWCYMRPEERPSFTPGLLADLADMQDSLKALFSGSAAPVHYYVLASHLPGIFNLGGDLTVLAEKIRRQDRGSLVTYARACIDVLYTNAVGFDLPVVTIALVQGDALGGGFEAALSCDVIIAERGARFGLPEVLFNLFPGMGAYSFLSRRVGAARAEKMILSGKIYTAEELYDLEIVQVLAESGAGEIAAQDYIERNRRRHNAQTGVFRAGRRVHPLNYDELRDITEIWVDTALRLKEADLRKMERLTWAQNRRWSGQLIAAAE